VASVEGRLALRRSLEPELGRYAPRVALADREDLGLTEARIRGAIKTLEAVCFLDRWLTKGSA
jgi:hypothetical protein